MVKTTLIIIGLVLCIFGLSELMHSISLLVASPKHKQKSCSVIWLKSGIAWNQLRYAKLQMRWHGTAYADVVIAVTDSIAEYEISPLCECFREGFVFCPSEAVADVIGSITGEVYTDGRNNKSSANRRN